MVNVWPRIFQTEILPCESTIVTDTNAQCDGLRFYLKCPSVKLNVDFSNSSGKTTFWEDIIRLIGFYGLRAYHKFYKLNFHINLENRVVMARKLVARG